MKPRHAPSGHPEQLAPSLPGFETVGALPIPEPSPVDITLDSVHAIATTGDRRTVRVDVASDIVTEDLGLRPMTRSKKAAAAREYQFGVNEAGIAAVRAAMTNHTPTEVRPEVRDPRFFDANGRAILGSRTRR